MPDPALAPVPASAAGIVLVGGRSSRMGRSKAALDWHGRPLLHHVASVLRRAVGGPVVVVAAPGQVLPELPAGVEIVEDPAEGRGPLQGIATGLAAVVARAPTAFVTATDLPFLHPAFIAAVLAGLADPAVDVVLPVAGGFPQTLAAGYRTALSGLVSELVTAGVLRPPTLFERCRVLRPDAAALLTDPDLAACDPTLAALTNVNTPEEYAAALLRPGPHGGFPARHPDAH